MTLRNRPRVGTGSPKVLFGESKAASRSLISSAVRGVLYGTAGAAPAVLSVEYVIVAGGGGGGNTNNFYSDTASGGGGAGGYRSSVTGEPSGGGAAAETALVPLLGYAYPVIVGAGGSGGGTGGNSRLGLEALRGGPGNNFGTASSGGSGGGAGATGFSYGTGGAGTAGQGFAGGNAAGQGGYCWESGGGGGASEAGENGSALGKGGDGGDGLTTNITGTPISLAGGGGGSDLRDAGFGTSVAGLGGLGGGANGRFYTGSGTGIISPGLNATANTGGGGGGTLGRSYSNTGGAGGSGRVLFKVESKYDSEITLTPGVVYTTTTVGDYTVYDITAAGSTDTVTFGTQTDYKWSLASPSYSGQSLDLSAQTTSAMGLTFSPNGTQLWVTGYSDDTIYEYVMSTPYDVANATFAQSNVFSASTYIRALRWKSDGTSVFVTYNTPNGTVYEYSVSTPYDISTKSVSPVRSHNFFSALFFDIEFKSDGTKMWAMANNDRVYEFALSTPWDITTETLTTAINVLSADPSMATVKWKPDGTRFYLVGISTDKVFEYIAINAFSLTGAFLANEYYIGTDVPTPYGIDFKPDGTEMFVTDYNLDKVQKYNLIP